MSNRQWWTAQYGSWETNSSPLKEQPSHQLVLVEGFSKRSSTDLCGRNDANLKVVFPDAEVEDITNSGQKVRAQPGDYVLVKITSASSQTLKGHVLCRTTMKDSSVYCLTWVGGSRVDLDSFSSWFGDKTVVMKPLHQTEECISLSLEQILQQ